MKLNHSALSCVQIRVCMVWHNLALITYTLLCVTKLAQTVCGELWNASFSASIQEIRDIIRASTVIYHVSKTRQMTNFYHRHILELYLLIATPWFWSFPLPSIPIQLSFIVEHFVICATCHFMCVCRCFDLTALHYGNAENRKHSSKDKVVGRLSRDKLFSMCLCDSHSLDLHHRETRLNGSVTERTWNTKRSVELNILNVRNILLLLIRYHWWVFCSTIRTWCSHTNRIYRFNPLDFTVKPCALHQYDWTSE